MTPTARILLATAAALASLPAGQALALSPVDFKARAESIREQTGVRGGMVVHLGCADGKLTTALGGERFTVHGLCADALSVETARRYIRSAGLYGPVSVGTLSGKRLPYTDNLVNLVVADSLGDVPMSEVLRVLCPGGAAWVGGKITRKPRPTDIDEWTHFLHDAGNNAVAADTRVGPPRRLQWQAGPLWLRSHETPSGVEAMVAGGGRVFYLLDEGLIGIVDQRLPERWALICRDAFNGKLLWRKPVKSWGWPAWAFDRIAGKDLTTLRALRVAVPDENQRRIVAAGDKLLATLGHAAPMSILDAATGKVLATVTEAGPANQIAASDGVAVVYTAAAQNETDKRRGKAPAASWPAKLTAVSIADAKVLWRRDIAGLTGLSLVVDGGRVVYQHGKNLRCLDLRTGKELWQVEAAGQATTLVACDGCVILRTGGLEVRDAATGQRLWSNPKVPSMWRQDVFVTGGVIWPGMLRKGDDVEAVGYDLKTGKPTKPIFAADLISPEHHHRCYRNKATARFVIGGYEGAEFLDLRGDQSGQYNHIRGSCRMGLVPCNGMLYVPPDQCFCQPGAKLLGMLALLPAAKSEIRPVPDTARLTRGPAYGYTRDPIEPSPDDWPTYRHDPARHGTTPAEAPTKLSEAWRVQLGAGLTAPVVAEGRAFAAAADAHTVFAIDLATGKAAWQFTAGGRVDSPPTVHRGTVLFGSADGCAYCLRASDGKLIWRFLAAPADVRVARFGQIESAWPVHGSVLVVGDTAYVSAGLSTYLDGGIRLWALDAASGKILHRATLEGPFPDAPGVERDVAFFVRGARSDVLVAEGGAIYMRQKRLSPTLEVANPEVLSSKGESDVGLHLFSTAGLLDGSWYNRTFWMYSKRWPGFQLANQAPKSGQLLCVDDANTYGVKVFYRRNVHSPMFFAGREGYLIFADRNANEPQIVGEKGAREPIGWLPQSDYDRARRGHKVIRKLDSPAFGLDKMMGYTRAEKPLWAVWQPVRARAMVKAANALLIAGPPDVLAESDPYAAFEGRLGACLVALSPDDGRQLSACDLPAPPAFDGMIAAAGRVLIALEDGSLICLTGNRR